MNELCINNLIEIITEKFAGVIPKSTWGETSLFYNPGLKLPNGIYFCTFKEKDGANDKASNLNRQGVFRLSIGLPNSKYNELFGDKPKRPSKGKIINTAHDFTQLNTLTPHPIYAWMSWVCINSPTSENLSVLIKLIEFAHQKAVKNFNKKFK